MPLIDPKTVVREARFAGESRYVRIIWDRLPRVLVAYVDALTQYRTDKVRVDPSRAEELRGAIAIHLISVWNAAHRQGRKELVGQVFAGDYLPPEPGFRDKVRDGQVAIHDALKEIAEKLA